MTNNPSAIRSQMGIRKRLFFLLLVVFVPLLFLEVFTYYKWFQTRKEAANQANLELARAVAKNFETFLHGLARSESGIGLALTGSSSITDRDRNRLLDSFASNNPFARNVMWMDLHGRVVAASDRARVGFNLEDRSFFSQVKGGQDWAVSEVTPEQATQKPVFTLGYGIRDRHDRLLGVVAVVVEPNQLDSVLGVARSGDASINLIDTLGIHAYRYPPLVSAWEQRNWLKFNPVPLREALKGREVVTVQTSITDGTRRVIAYVPISSIGWVAACDQSETEVTAAIVRALLPQAALTFLITLAALGWAVILSRPITAPLIKMRTQAEALGRGEIENVEVEAAPDELVKLVDTLNQVTQRVRAREEALRVNADLINLSHEAMFVWELHGAIVSWNLGATRLYGFNEEEAIGQVSYRLLQTVFPAFVENITSHLEQKGELSGELVHKMKGGRAITVESRLQVISGPSGKQLVLEITRDITERKQNEEALRKAHDELEVRVQERTSDLWQALGKLRAENAQRKELEDTLRESENRVRFFASQVLTAQETERKRVAGELHDSIASALGAIKFRMETLEERMDQENGAAQSLRELSSKVTEINNEVRRIMADLRPAVLDDLGIIAATRWLCREYEKTYSHIRVEQQVGIAEDEVPDSLKTPVFRIAQEALNNVAKHSQASLVKLSLEKENSGIMLTIQDNGHGFDAESVRRGYGLSTMMERAQFSGGSFNLASAAGKGTTVRVSWPI